MTEERGSDTPAAADRPTIRCEQCGQQVPAMRVCIRCGDPLEPELRKGSAGRMRTAYAAAPEESARAVRLVSTLYPALPREEIRTFQTALVAGTILVVVLAALGFFPVAVVAAAVLVPLVTVIYLYDVDTYEDEPVRVVALTFLWGLVTGAVFAWVLDQVVPVTAASAIGGSVVGGGGGSPFPWERTIVAPIVAGVLMALGPALLLSQKRFNDVLDGATFGVASAVAFVGAQTIVTSISLFQSGLHPTGEVFPWIVRIVALGVAMPVIAAGAIGGFVGVLWLRYRGPDAHEDMLGPLGQPVVAALLAGALLVAAGLVQELVKPVDGVSQLVDLAALAILAIVALVWLRRIIHVGLLQESLEIPVGPDIRCANCGRSTPTHSYCGDCGVSLRALPKARPVAQAAGGVAAASARVGDIAAPHEVRTTDRPAAPEAHEALPSTVTGGSVVAPRPASKGWLGPRKLLVLFAVLLGAVTAIALVVAFVVSQGLDQPECQDIAPCGAAVLAPITGVAARSSEMPFPPMERYTDTTTGFAFEYDPDALAISKSGPGWVQLAAHDGSLLYVVEAAQAQALGPEQLFNKRRDLTSQNLLGFQLDREPARQLLGTPILGHRSGVAALFGGTLDTPQGPGLDLAVASVAATDGSISAVTTVWVAAQNRRWGLAMADTMNNTFIWPNDPVVE